MTKPTRAEKPHGFVTPVREAIDGLTVISGGAGAVVGAALAALLARHHAANLTGQLAEGGLGSGCRRGRASKRHRPTAPLATRSARS